MLPGPQALERLQVAHNRNSLPLNHLESPDAAFVGQEWEPGFAVLPYGLLLCPALDLCFPSMFLWPLCLPDI